MPAMKEKKRKPRAPKAAPPAANPWPGILKRLRAEVGQRERLGRDLTQTEAGTWVGISQNLWSAWERGTRTPDLSRQILIHLLAEGKLPKPKK